MTYQLWVVAHIRVWGWANEWKLGETENQFAAQAAKNGHEKWGTFPHGTLEIRGVAA